MTLQLHSHARTITTLIPLTSLKPILYYTSTRNTGIKNLCGKLSMPIWAPILKFRFELSGSTCEELALVSYHTSSSRCPLFLKTSKYTPNRFHFHFHFHLFPFSSPTVIYPTPEPRHLDNKHIVASGSQDGNVCRTLGSAGIFRRWGGREVEVEVSFVSIAEAAALSYVKDSWLGKGVLY